ncbi:ABC transporter permease [Methanosphaerula subterraneus]|uniref:ABC transporter permease n=1 Tax=Methanosphaerula subterraneus TaxID=3350244 RepID=UPI003F8647FD
MIRNGGSDRSEAGGSRGGVRNARPVRLLLTSPLIARALALVLTLVTCGYLILPLAALFTRTTLTLFLESLKNPVVLDALYLSMYTATATMVAVVLVGTPFSYLHARHVYPGRFVVDALIDLPLLLPPAVAGLALLLTFGRNGLLGQYIHLFGVDIAFTTVAVVMAQIFVASPFYLRQARTSFEGVDQRFEQISWTLGASPIRTFFTITLPLAGSGLLSGAIMTFARALGEFGATIMFAGNLQGRTQTMPLAIYSTMQGDLNGSVTMAILMVIISFGVMVTVKVLTRGERHA